MAERRMFAKTIIDSDAFLDMPQTTQLLYFHLSMRADDDGFINNPKSIMRNVRCTEDDMKVLISKKYIIPFESGVVVIKHWKIHNYIAKDRYQETKYKEEKATLMLDENKAYTQNVHGLYTECIQVVDEMDTQVRIGKDSVVKDNNKAPKGAKRFIPPTVDEVRQYCQERNNNVDAESFVDFYQSKEWYVGKNKMKDWKASVRTWERRDRDAGRVTENNRQNKVYTDEWCDHIYD